MIDLHTHSLLSDGAFVPSEHVRRVEALGYEAIAITDHADSSNLHTLISSITLAAKELNPVTRTRLIIGVELTHVPPASIKQLTEKARQLGAQLVVAHGETPVEPVLPGTNRAALEAGVDILAHPGFISEDDAAFAAENDVYLELSGRKGHCLTNGHVARMAAKTGARLVLNADAHDACDFLTTEMAEKVGIGAGISKEDYLQIRKNMKDILNKIE